jgi:hypothetical protein
MRRVLLRGVAGVVLLVACIPTEPCACPPARTSLVIYGEVRAAGGNPVPSAVVHYVLAPPAIVTTTGSVCQFDATRGDAEPAQVRADAAGRFRTLVYSVYEPGTRCLRVTAHAPGAVADSASVSGLLVPFRVSRPDSIGVVVMLH